MIVLDNVAVATNGHGVLYTEREIRGEVVQYVKELVSRAIVDVVDGRRWNNAICRYRAIITFAVYVRCILHIVNFNV